MEPAVLKYMEEHKVAHLERVRQALLVTCFCLMEQVITPSLALLSGTTMVPHIINIYLMSKARLIVDTPTTTVMLTDKGFAPLISLLPTLAQCWRPSIESQYIQHVSLNEHTVASDSVLDLVTSCKHCGNILFFPDSLAHECRNLPHGHRKDQQPKYKKKRTWEESQEIEARLDLIHLLPVYERVACDLSAYMPWSCDQDSFEKEITVICNIVEVCGKYPNKVTCTKMDSLDARLSCDMCSQNGRMVVVTWCSAVSPISLVSCRQFF